MVLKKFEVNALFNANSAHLAEYYSPIVQFLYFGLSAFSSVSRVTNY